MTEETPFRIVLIVASVLQAVISFFYFKKARAGSTIFRRREEGLLLTIAIALPYAAYALGLLAYLINPVWMDWSSIAFPAGVRWSAIVPLLLGGGLMLLGLRHLGFNLSISISTKTDHSLITSGPYRRIRHPLYAGGMLESVGVCLLMANWFVALTAALFWVLIAYRTPLEEKKLIECFGDEYREYMQQTGRFLPRMG